MPTTFHSNNKTKTDRQPATSKLPVYSIKDTKNPKIYVTPVRYLKNIGKSVTYSAIDKFKDINPTLADYASTNSDLGKMLYESVKDIKGTLQKGKSYALQSKVGEFAIEYKKALFEDIKTGKFYNKERIDQMTTRAGGTMMEGFDDDPFAGLDAEWDDSSLDFGGDDDNDWDLDDDTLASIEANDKIGQKVSQSINTGTIKAAEYVSKSNAAALHQMQLHNEALFGKLNIGLGAINSSLGSLIGFANGVLKTHADNSQKYYDVTTKLDQERNALLKQLVDMQSRMVTIAQEEKKSSNISMHDVASGGIPDVKMYGKKILQNLNNMTMGMGDMANMFEGGNTLLMFAGSPLKGATDHMVKKAIPKAMEKSMKELNKTMEGFFDTYINKMNYMAKNSEAPILQKLGELLGIENYAKTSIDSSKYNKGPIPYDGVSKEALTTVLPSYLAKIESALTGTSERVYDYKTGRWTKLSIVKSNFDKALRSSSDDAASDVTNEMFQYINRVGNGNTRQSAENIRALKKKASEMFYQTFLNGGMVNFRDKNFNYNAAGITSDEWAIISGALSNVNKATMMQYANKMNRNIASSNSRLKDAEKTGGIERHLFSNFGIDEYSQFDPVTGRRYTARDYANNEKLKGKRMNSILTLPEDEYGHNQLFYLRMLHEDVRNMKQNGVGGGSGNYGDRFSTSPRVGGSSYSTPDNSGRSVAQYTREQENREIESDSNRIEKELKKIGIMSEDGRYQWKGQYFDINDLDEDAERARRQMFSFFKSAKTQSEFAAKAKELAQREKDNKGIFNKIYNKMAMSGNVSDSMKQFITGSRNLARKPGEKFTSMIDNVNSYLYKVMYGDDEEKLDFNSFMGQLSARMATVFSDVGSFIKDDVFLPIKDSIAKELLGEKYKDRFDKFTGSIYDKYKGNMKEFAKRAVRPYWDPIKGTFVKGWKGFRHEMLGEYSHVNNQMMNNAIRRSHINSIEDPREAELFDMISSGDYDEDQEYDMIRAHEGQFAKGARMIKKTGLAVLSRGEMVIPSERNPYFSGNTNKAMQVKQESAIAKKYLKAKNKLYSDQNGSIPMFNTGIASVGENNVSDEQYFSESDVITKINSDGTRSYWTKVNGRAFQVKKVKSSKDDKSAAPRFKLMYSRDLYDGTGALHQATDKISKGAGTLFGWIKESFKKQKKKVVDGVSKNDKDDELYNNMVDNFADNVKQYLPEITGGAGVGIIASVLTGAFGPLLGAAAGAGISLIHNSGTIKDWLFGEKYTDEATGKEHREGNVISGHIADNIEKYFPGMAKGAGVGAITSIMPFVPGGPVAGIIVGSAIGFAKNNETIQSKLFGTMMEDGTRSSDGLITPDFLKKLKEARPDMLIGSVAGALTMPFGLIPNLFLGSALGFVASTDQFKDIVFGKLNPETEKREGGITGALQTGFVDPLTKFGNTMMDEFKKWWKDGFTGPISDALKPIGKQASLFFGGIMKSIATKADKLVGNHLGVPLSKYIEERVFKPAAGLVKGSIKSTLRPITAIAKAPVGIIKHYGNKWRNQQINNGNADYLTAEERLAWRDQHEIDNQDNLFGNMRNSYNNYIGGHLSNGKNSILGGLGRIYGNIEEAYDKSRGAKRGVANVLKVGSTLMGGWAPKMALRHIAKNQRNHAYDGTQTARGDFFKSIDQNIAGMNYEDIRSIKDTLTGLSDPTLFRQKFKKHQDSAISKVNKVINDNHIDLSIGDRKEIFDAMKLNNTAKLYQVLRRLDLPREQKNALMKAVSESFAELQSYQDINDDIKRNSNDVYDKLGEKFGLGKGQHDFLSNNIDKMKSYFTKEFEARKAKGEGNANEAAPEERRHSEIVSLFRELINEVGMLGGGDKAKDIKRKNQRQNNMEMIKLRGAFKHFDSMSKKDIHEVDRTDKNGQVSKVSLGFYCDEYNADKKPVSGFDSEGNPVTFDQDVVNGKLTVNDMDNGFTYHIEPTSVINMVDRSTVNENGTSAGNKSYVDFAKKSKSIFGRGITSAASWLNNVGLTNTKYGVEKAKDRAMQKAMEKSDAELMRGYTENGDQMPYEGNYKWALDADGNATRFKRTEDGKDWEPDETSTITRASIINAEEKKNTLTGIIGAVKGVAFDFKNIFDKIFFIKKEDTWAKRFFKVAAVSGGFLTITGFSDKIYGWWKDHLKPGLGELLEPVKATLIKGAIALDTTISKIPTAIEVVGNKISTFFSDKFPSILKDKVIPFYMTALTNYLPRIIENIVPIIATSMEALLKATGKSIWALITTPFKIATGNTTSDPANSDVSAPRRIANNVKNFNMFQDIVGNYVGDDEIAKYKSGQGSGVQVTTALGKDGYRLGRKKFLSGGSSRLPVWIKKLSGGDSGIGYVSDEDGAVYNDAAGTSALDQYYYMNGNAYNVSDIADAATKTAGESGDTELYTEAKGSLRDSLLGKVGYSSLRNFLAKASGRTGGKFMAALGNKLWKYKPARLMTKPLGIVSKVAGASIKVVNSAGNLGTAAYNALNKPTVSIAEEVASNITRGARSAPSQVSRTLTTAGENLLKEASEKAVGKSASEASTFISKYVSDGLDDVMKTAGKGLKSKQKKALLNTVKNTVLSGDKVKAAEELAEVATKKSFIGKVIDTIFSKPIKKLTGIKNGMVTKIKEKLASIFSTKTGAKALKGLKIVGTVLNVVFIVSDFMKGYNNAANYLGIIKTDTPTGLKIISGIVNAFLGLLTFGLANAGGFVDVTKLIISAIGKLPCIGVSEQRLESLRNKAKYVVAAWNKENGENISLEEYNDRQGLWFNIKNNTWGRLTGNYKKATKNVLNATKLHHEALQKYIETGDLRYIEMAKEYIDVMDAKNSGLPYSYGGIASGFVSQIDPSYKNIPFMSLDDTIGQTIETSGCGPASAAMAINSLTNNPISLTDAANYALENNLKSKNSGVNVEYFDKLYRTRGLTAKYSDSKDYIKNMISNTGNVVLLGQDTSNTSKKKSPFGPNNHYVLADKIDGNKVIIKDPEQGKSRQYSLDKILSKTKLGIGSSTSPIASAIPSSARNLSAAGSSIKRRFKNAKATNSLMKYNRYSGGASSDPESAFFHALRLILLTETSSMDTLKFGTVTNDTGGYLSLGILQWFKERATGLLKSIIASMGQSAAYDFIKSKFSDKTASDIITTVASGKIFGPSGAIDSTEIRDAIGALITSPKGIEAQLDLARTDIKAYYDCVMRHLPNGIDQKIVVYFIQAANNAGHGQGKNGGFNRTAGVILDDLMKTGKLTNATSYDAFLSMFKSHPQYNTVTASDKSTGPYFVQKASRFAKVEAYMSAELLGRTLVNDFNGGVSNAQIKRMFSMDSAAYVTGGEEKGSWLSSLFNKVKKLGNLFFGIKDEDEEVEESVYDPDTSANYLDALDQANNTIDNISNADFSYTGKDGNAQNRYDAYNALYTLLHSKEPVTDEVLAKANGYLNLLRQYDNNFAIKYGMQTTTEGRVNYLRQYLEDNAYLGGTSISKNVEKSLNKEKSPYISPTMEKNLTGLIDRSSAGIPVTYNDTEAIKLNDPELMRKMYVYHKLHQAAKKKLSGTTFEDNIPKIKETFMSGLEQSGSALERYVAKLMSVSECHLFKIDSEYASFQKQAVYDYLSPIGGNIFAAVITVMRNLAGSKNLTKYGMYDDKSMSVEESSKGYLSYNYDKWTNLQNTLAIGKMKYGSVTPAKLSASMEFNNNKPIWEKASDVASNNVVSAFNKYGAKISSKLKSGKGSSLVPDFISQRDPRYSNLGFGENTLGDAGCGPATAAMAINGLINQKARATGMSILDAASQAKGYTDREGTKASYFGDIASKYGANAEYTSNKSKVTDDLKSGKQVVLLGRDKSNDSKEKSPFGPNNHYILAKGLSGNKVLVNDPELSGPKIYDKSILNKTSLGISISGGNTGLTKLFGDNGAFTSLQSKLFGVEVTNEYTADTSSALNYRDGGATSEGARIVAIARNYIGKVAYVYGAKTPDSGVSDCSGFTSHVYKKAGYTSFGGDSRTQGTLGVGVSKSDLQLGDLVFFYGTNKHYSGNTITHVGIYSGNGMMINCRSVGVIEESIDGMEYWRTRYHSARRVIRPSAAMLSGTGSNITSERIFNDAKTRFKKSIIEPAASGSGVVRPNRRNVAPRVSGGASNVSTLGNSSTNGLLKQILTAIDRVASNTVSVSQIVVLLTALVELAKGKSNTSSTSKKKSGDNMALIKNQLLQGGGDNGNKDMANLFNAISTILTD